MLEPIPYQQMSVNIISNLCRVINYLCFAGSTFIQQALEGEYPKFLRLYIEMCSRLQAWCDQLTPAPLLLGTEGVEGAVGNPQFSIK
jgi:hypothetical protein